MKGWVYVISNKAMPAFKKVGFSMSDPEERAVELNHTGTPHPYVVEYDCQVEEPREVERKAHELLRDQREGKEWFHCSTETAIAAIKRAVGSKFIVENYKYADRKRVEEIRRNREDAERKMLFAVEQRRARDVLRNEKRQAIMARYAAILPDTSMRRGALLGLCDGLFGTHRLDANAEKYIKLINERTNEIEAFDRQCAAEDAREH